MPGIVIDAAPTPAAAPVVPDPDAPATRPDNVPEKFWDAEKGVTNWDAMANSYGELEKKQSAAPIVPDPVAPAVDPAAPVVPDPAAEAAAAALAGGPIDYPTLEAEYAKDGVLSAASYEKLASQGFNKEVVDTFVSDRVSAGEKVYNEAVAVVGGDAQFQHMATWASENYSPAQAAAFNAGAESSDPGRMAQAMSALKSDYEAVNGVVPTLLTPTTVAPSGGDLYMSMPQLLADQNSDLYRNDPAERARVFEKLKRSDAAGKI